MKFLSRAFDRLYKQIEKPKISWTHFKVDTNDAVVMNLMAEMGPDEQLVLEGYILTINGIDEDVFFAQLETLIEEFFDEEKLNLESSNSTTKLYQHITFLIWKFNEVDKQIGKSRNRYKHRKSTIDEKYNDLLTEGMLNRISDIFYKQKIIGRKIMKRLVDISNELEKQIEVKGPQNNDDLMNSKHRLN